MPARAPFDVVRRLGLALPGVEEGTTYGAPALKLRGALLCCMATNKSAERGTLVVRVDDAMRDELIEADPDIYYLTPHYEHGPAVLVRLSRIHRDALGDLLEAGHRFVDARSRKTRRTTATKRKR